MQYVRSLLLGAELRGEARDALGVLLVILYYMLCKYTFVISTRSERHWEYYIMCYVSTHSSLAHFSLPYNSVPILAYNTDTQPCRYTIQTHNPVPTLYTDTQPCRCTMLSYDTVPPSVQYRHTTPSPPYYTSPTI